MIPLTDLCVSRELAERMAKLGFKPKTRFIWVTPNLRAIEECHLSYIYETDLDGIDAPISSEIELPDLTNTFKDCGEWICDYYYANDKTQEQELYRFGANTEAEAKGLMWCHLKVNKLI